MVFTTKARALEECLVSLIQRVREIRGLILVDPDGLPLVSTLHSPALEEALGAFAGATVMHMKRAEGDFQMGPLYFMHIAARDRQLFVTPVIEGVMLMAIVDAEATASSIALHMLAMTREILILVCPDEPRSVG
jgi:predicted regulator of Ras-like GTPase activity (Roadblock/LC7/MglB family)